MAQVLRGAVDVAVQRGAVLKVFGGSLLEGEAGDDLGKLVF